ncbi:MAG: sulfatase-like hydrolase/transferase [Acidobacteria bacterium]|nr:sulfatase-like hydrolase/transferase [Acidobacteriota bacterium]
MRAGASVVCLSLRLVFVAFCFLTSAYCLMAYLPFTYQQVIDLKVIPGTGGFALLHPWLYWLALVCGAWTLADGYKPGTRFLIVGFLVTGAIGGVLLVVSPLLPGLRNESGSLVWAAIWLIPPVWTALIDFAGSRRALTWGTEDSGEDLRLFVSCALVAVAVALLYAGTQRLRAAGVDAMPGVAAGTPGVVVWSVGLHLVAFLGGFAALVFIRGIAGLARRRALAEFVLVTLAASVLLVGVIRTVVFAAISFVGTPGLVMAMAYAATIGLATAGLAVKLWPVSEPVRSGIELAVSPVSLPRGTPRLVRIGLLGFWMWLGYVLATSTAMLDWNYLVQTMAALAIWGIGFAWIYGVLPIRRPVTAASTMMLLAIPVALLLGYRVLATTPTSLAALGIGPDDRLARFDRYAGYDVSFRVLHNLVRTEPGSAVSASTDAGPAVDMGQFFALLQRHTNISRTVTIDVPELGVAPPIAPFAGRAPHIFIIVIDSLRPDYLSPYNPSVAFTPAVDRFAKDAGTVVFRKAFTRYGATGLSEPAIWTGAMVPHQQYPATLGRANSLQRLLQAQNYQGFVSVDGPLQSALAPWPGLIELDKGIPNMSYDARRSLEELESRLRSRPPTEARPVFAYTQPQNIHVSAIAREGKSVPAGEAYPGFYPPYASRVKIVDAAFGRFLDALRELGLYDDSVVILTSDHGDSLGEDGRFGHAYTIYPEILRIPLLVHLPTWLRHLSVDAEAVAMSTDITPSLYYMLGQRPTVNDPLFGRPLFTERPEERASHGRDAIVVGSSYGPVYGSLAGDGSSLFIADATNYREYRYDLTTGFAGTPRTATPAERAAAVRRIREGLQQVARTYRIPIE